MNAMNRRALLLLIVIHTVALGCSGAKSAAPRAVQKLDVDRFMGMWYEIARLPFLPERDCAAFSSRYEKVSEEEFAIVNYCWHKSVNGPMRKTRAEAYMDTTENAAKLKIQLNWPAWRDLWILYVDEKYEHAVLGTPDRENLWILSRTPRIEDHVLKELKDLAKRQGFDISRLIFDAQPEIGIADPSGTGN